MKSELLGFLVAVVLATSNSWSLSKFSPLNKRTSLVGPHFSSRQSRRDRQAAAVESGGKSSFEVGENVPDEIKQLSVLYDMILVERLSTPEQTATGIILPKTEGKDKRQLGRVLSVPGLHGLESEHGRVQPDTEICPGIKPGDTVFLRDPWGIGPKNIEIGERKFSFHKAAHITGVVR